MYARRIPLGECWNVEQEQVVKCTQSYATGERCVESEVVTTCTESTDKGGMSPATTFMVSSRGPIDRTCAPAAALQRTLPVSKRK